MTYEEIENYPRPYDRKRFPVIGHVEVEAERFGEFEKKANDQTQIKLIGHDLGDDGVVAHVACTSSDVLRRLERMWR